MNKLSNSCSICIAFHKRHKLKKGSRSCRIACVRYNNSHRLLCRWLFLLWQFLLVLLLLLWAIPAWEPWLPLLAHPWVVSSLHQGWVEPTQVQYPSTLSQGLLLAAQQYPLHRLPCLTRSSLWEHYHHNIQCSSRCHSFLHMDLRRSSS